MVQGNLSTRPFYNERGVHALLLVVGIVVAAFTAFNVTQLVSLSRRQAALEREAADAEARAGALRAEANRLRASIRPEELEAVQAAAREANAIIERRTFSWTALFNDIESTLPADVMLTAVRPSIGEGKVTIRLVVIGREVEDVDAFMQELERSGSFTNMLSTEEETLDDGTIRATLVGQYLPRDHAPATTPAAPEAADETPRAEARR